MQAAILAVVPQLALAGNEQAQGHAAAGHAVARTWCTGCHVVDAGQKVASAAGAPSFAAIAAMPSSTPQALHAFLAAPHPPMPDFQVSRQQVDDITAYILSLKKP
ncbi:MAG: c-type cytochrome [Nevskia sp.]|nr:c-type cytochrome [Nevskia sp.]